MLTELRWLHLSDFHCHKKNTSFQEKAMESLLENIKEKHTENDKPDLIFITGDISFSGQKEEFNIAQTFIDKLRDIVSIDKEYIFFVPGNHDIDRTEEEDAIIGARKQIINRLELERIYYNPKRLQTLYKRQANYREFVNRNRSSKLYDIDSSVHNIEVQIKSVKLKILLLDSAWLSHDDNDSQKLVLGEKQITDSIETTNKSHLVISLMHHPLSWLQDFERFSIEELLIKHSHIFLHGHVHQGDLSLMEKNNQKLIISSAGASYESRAAQNSYSFGKIDLLTGYGENRTSHFLYAENRWVTSEPSKWRIQIAPTTELKEIYNLIKPRTKKFSCYITCLIKNLRSDIPIKHNEKFIILNKNSNLEPKSKIRTSIHQLQWLIYFKYAWKSEKEWVGKFDIIVTNLETSLSDCYEMETQLNKMENESQDTINSLLSQDNQIESIENQVNDLLSTCEYKEIFILLERWENAEFLNDAELIYLKIKKLKIAMSEGSKTKISKILNSFNNENFSAENYFAIASAYYFLEDYQNAETAIIKSLDMGFNIDQSRQLVRAIAGKTGSRKLAQRVAR